MVVVGAQYADRIDPHMTTACQQDNAQHHKSFRLTSWTWWRVHWTQIPQSDTSKLCLKKWLVSVKHNSSHYLWACSHVTFGAGASLVDSEDFLGTEAFKSSANLSALKTGEEMVSHKHVTAYF